MSIPASVEQVSELAFCHCRLESAVFAAGSRLRTVGDYAFGRESGVSGALTRGDVAFPKGATVSDRAFGYVRADTNWQRETGISHYV